MGELEARRKARSHGIDVADGSAAGHRATAAAAYDQHLSHDRNAQDNSSEEEKKYDIIDYEQPSGAAGAEDDQDEFVMIPAT